MGRLRGVFIGPLLVTLGALAAGCGGSVPVEKKAAFPLKGERIVVAAFHDRSALPAVIAQRGEWEQSRGAACQVLDDPAEKADLKGAHVLVFSGEMLGTLVDIGALAVLPEALLQPSALADTEVGEPEVTRPAAPTDTPEADSVQFSDVIPAFREQVSKYGNDRVALPIGGTALVLVYNRRAFEREANQAAAKKAGVSLVPPSTWKDLDRLAGFFQGRDWDGDGSDDSGIALAMGTDSERVGDATFLARAAALGQHRAQYSLLFDSDSMEPLVASPPFVEALEGLVALKSSGPSGVEGFDAPAARKAFKEGRVALLIDRAEQAGKWGGGKVKAVGVAPLPGSERVYEPDNKVWENPSSPNRPSYLPGGGGWLVGVAASARGRQREAAIDFAKYLINPETSNRVRADPNCPMLPVRGSQVGAGLIDPRSSPGVDSRAWSEAVSKTLLAPRVVPGLRIPDATGYLADLAAARVAAAGGEPARAALDRAAEAWAARTRSLGIERQLWHYRRSLNSLVTTPKPPR